MSHIIANRKKLVSRIRRISGQAAALEERLQNDADCLSVLQQISAIRGAVNGLMKEVLESHVREHLGSEGLSATQRQQEVEAVIKVLKSYLK